MRRLTSNLSQYTPKQLVCLKNLTRNRNNRNYEVIQIRIKLLRNQSRITDKYQYTYRSLILHSLK